ncbi:MAG: GNAT family N-acetyltransferase [Butyricicoccus sp.]|nr:GNAT family N-acetyltransferase [Butyricicoccus sp.]
MEIRFLSEHDSLLDVSAVYEQSWKHAYKGIIPQSYLDSIPAGFWAQGLGKSGMYNLLALENGRIIGTSCFCKSRWEKFHNYGEIVSIYFLPEYMRKGFGSALLGRAVEELKTLGFSKILLWVLEDNVPAKSFYEKNGFTPAGEYMSGIFAGKELREQLYVLEED